MLEKKIFIADYNPEMSTPCMHGIPEHLWCNKCAKLSNREDQRLYQKTRNIAHDPIPEVDYSAYLSPEVRARYLQFRNGELASDNPPRSTRVRLVPVAQQAVKDAEQSILKFWDEGKTKAWISFKVRVSYTSVRNVLKRNGRTS